jgi:two-component system, NarL family, nitrate/nitrite response regulator NarL
MTSGTESRARIRVLIVADVRLYREGLTASLGCYDSVLVAGTASDRAKALAASRTLSPDVALVDMAMSYAFELMRDLRVEAPKTGLVAFAIDENMSTIIACAQAGASAYVTVDASIDEVVTAIERTAAGELLCSPRVTAELFRRLGQQSGPRETIGSGVLTAREQQVLGVLSRGLSNKEIAASLSISEATVKNHVHHLLEKLQVDSRAQAALCAAHAAGRHLRVNRLASDAS